MFERYTETARRTIFFAALEAAQCRSTVFSAEHILLGLTWAGGAALRDVVRLTDQAVILRAHLQLPIPQPPYHTAPLGKIPLDDFGKQVVAYAEDEAKLDGDFWIDGYHLLRALLRFPNRGGDALSHCGFTLDGLHSLAAQCRLQASPPTSVWLKFRASIAQNPYLWGWLAVMGFIALFALALLVVLKLRGPL